MMIRYPYRDNMTPAEQAELLAACDALDGAYGRADREYDRWLEWVNMLNGGLDPEHVEDHYNELRKAALDHRGRP